MNFLAMQTSRVGVNDSPASIPLRRHRLGVADVLVTAACTLAVLCVAWWALAAPLRDLPGNQPGDVRDAVAGLTTTGSAGAIPAAALDLAVFRTPLWVAPPTPPAPSAPPPPPAKEPPPPPLKWQLLAIINAGPNSPSPRAMLYDPDSDSVFELAAGQKQMGNDIERIDDGKVTIRQGRHSYTLSLEHPVAASAAGGAK